MNKWTNPDQDHLSMINLMKNKIEHLGIHSNGLWNTRFWPGTPSSLIDHCWQNCPQRIIKVENIDCSLSDHNILKITIRIIGSVSQPREILARDWSKFIIKDYQDEVGRIDWTDLLEESDINLANNIFEEKIKNILDKAAPMRVSQIKIKNKSWITKTTRDVMKERDLARNVASQLQRDQDWSEYRRLRNKCNALTKSDKKKHFNDLFDLNSKSNISELYKNVKSQLGWKTSGPPQSLLIKDKIVKTSEGIAEAQMDYFETKVKKLIEDIPDTTTEPTKHLEEALENWGTKATQ